jgi:2-polyprenyl-3-methyl-5-hydroxy-6-metoxy-1,4-benzoquinol methylase
MGKDLVFKKYEKHIWTNDQIKNFWIYENNFPDKFWGKNFGAALVKNYKNEIKNSEKILDFGCGDGSLMQEIASIKKNKIIYGYENSPKIISNLKTKFKNKKNFSFLTSFRDKKFDLIFCTEVIEHLYDSDLQKLIKTLISLKSPNGYIIFSTPNNEVIEDSLILNPINNKLFHRWQHVRSWNKSSLQKFLIENNFKEFYFIETTLWNYSQNFIRNLYRKFYYKNLNLILKTK